MKSKKWVYENIAVSESPRHSMGMERDMSGGSMVEHIKAWRAEKKETNQDI